MTTQNFTKLVQCIRNSKICKQIYEGRLIQDFCPWKDSYRFLMNNKTKLRVFQLNFLHRSGKMFIVPRDLIN